MIVSNKIEVYLHDQLNERRWIARHNQNVSGKVLQVFLLSLVNCSLSNSVILFIFVTAGNLN